MNPDRARLLIIGGAVGVLLTGALVTAGLVQGHSRVPERGRVTACGPVRPSGAVVDVTLDDRGIHMMDGGGGAMLSLIASPDTASPGTVTFVATNDGVLDHELLILPAPENGVGTRTVSDVGRIDESSSLAEASTSCGPGAGQGIAPGASSWVTLRLTPGHYELLCDVPWHYANGMFAAFTVR